MALYCPRCYLTFENEDQLNNHFLAATVCERRTAIPIEGFNKEQHRALKERKAMFRATEEQRWVAMYLILFPDTVLGKVPSPCKIGPCV
jgi:hypothetical protein